MCSFIDDLIAHYCRNEDIVSEVEFLTCFGDETTGEDPPLVVFDSTTDTLKELCLRYIKIAAAPEDTISKLAEFMLTIGFRF